MLEQLLSVTDRAGCDKVHQKSTHRYGSITALHPRILLDLWGTDCLDIVGKNGKTDQLLVNAGNRHTPMCSKRPMDLYLQTSKLAEGRNFSKKWGRERILC